MTRARRSGGPAVSCAVALVACDSQLILAAADDARQIVDEAQKRTDCEVAALRRAAAGVRRQGEDHRQALDPGAPRLARAEQGGAAIHGAGRSQGRRAADRQPPGPRVGSMDVDAGDRARSAHRAAGSIDAVLRHRLQLRGSRGARRRSVRVHAARRRKPIDGADCWKIQSMPKQAKSSQYTRSVVWIRKDNYAFARIENYVKDQVRAPAELLATSATSQGIWTARQLR